MAAYRRVDDLRSPAGWLPVHRNQLRAQRSVSSMWSLYLLPFYLLIQLNLPQAAVRHRQQHGVVTTIWRRIDDSTRCREALAHGNICHNIWQTVVGMSLTDHSQCKQRHSLQFALNRALSKIFGPLSKDTYIDICNYFGIWPMEQQISARQDKFHLRYCASDSAVCCAISKLR